MRLQSQLLSEKRFDEHLDPLPFDGCEYQALKRLDVSGIQAARSPGNLLHLKPFTFQLHSWDRSLTNLSALCLPALSNDRLAKQMLCHLFCARANGQGRIPVREVPYVSEEHRL